MEGISQRLSDYDSWSSYLTACTDASIFCLGDKKKHRRSALFEDEAGEPDIDTSQPWNVWVAQSISKLGLQIQKALGDRLHGSLHVLHVMSFG